jgi:hypothetical protein
VERPRSDSQPESIRLGIATVFKNEGPYLLEWLAHHRSIGVDHFFLYDNESDDFSPEIFDRLSTLSWVTVLPWSTVDGRSPQLTAYNDARVRAEGIVDYAAFIDADEFLIPTSKLTLKDVLLALDESCSNFGALGINQIVFGSNGETEIKAEPVLKRFRRKVFKWKKEAAWVKSIYKISCVANINDPHRSILKSGFLYYNTSGGVLEYNDRYLGVVDKLDLSALQINHYITKSKQEFLAKKLRGGGAAATQAERKKRYANDSFFDSRLGMVAEVDAATRQFAIGIDEKIRVLKAGLGVPSEIERNYISARKHKIPSRPHGPPENAEVLSSAMAAATNYLEYGAGASTIMAAGVPTLQNIISVESDRDWLESVRIALQGQGACLAKHHLLYANLGQTGEWGFPVNSSRWQFYQKYSVDAWLHCKEKSIKPDLVLVDGRFRVACFLATLLFAEAGCRVLFDDYFDRPYYHTVEKYASPSDTIGRLSLFTVPSQLSRDEIWVDLLAAVTDVR